MSRRMIQAAVVVALLAIAVIVVREQQKSAGETAWAELAAARMSETPIEALEAARESAKGTSAEPLAAYHLAMQLYSEGSRDDLGRAREVAQLTVEAFPDHAVTPPLKHLLSAIDSYLVGS